MDEIFKSPEEKAKAASAGYPEMAKAELKRYEKLLSARRAVFDSSWETLSRYYQPNFSDIDTTKTEGTSGWSDLIFDTTAIEDARTCTTGQANWATPAAEPWYGWSPPKYLNQDIDDDGAIWCGMCSEIGLDELSRSNYYSESGLQYKSRTVFGTGHLHIQEGKKTTLNCRARKIGTYCLGRDDEGYVDTVYSESKYTARALAQKFGSEACERTEKIWKALNDNKGINADTEFVIVHVIRPREELARERGKIDAENKPIASIYIAQDDKVCLEVGGYDEMPDSVTRFDDWGTGSVWGYSPAFETLPNVRQLNYLVRFMDGQYELRANPRILEPVTSWGQVDLRPGGRTPFDPNLGEVGMPREWMTQADIQGTETSVTQKQAAVHRMFYTDVFTMLQQIDRKMTAYEISQRIGEKLEQLSPMFGRLITEKTSVDLKRVFGILFRAGRFPKPPRSMYVPDASGKKLKLAMPEVSYSSRLALALKALQNKAMMDTLQFVIEAAKGMGKPELLDNWDLDAAFRAFAINQGMSARYERPMRQVIQLRSARAKQAAQDRAMAMAEQASKAAKNLGSAPQKLQDSVSDQIPENSGGGGSAGSGDNVVPIGSAA